MSTAILLPTPFRISTPSRPLRSARLPTSAQLKKRLQPTIPTSWLQSLWPPTLSSSAPALINFNIYSGLKSWIDNVARAGQTFKYTETGPVGLATGKKVYIVLAAAGVYSEGPAVSMNHAVPYLKTVLGFMGMTDVEVIYVEGLAFGPEAVEKAVAAAEAKVAELAQAA